MKRLTNIQLAFVAVFLVALSFATFRAYRTTQEHHVLYPQNILAGLSQAPNQYRVLAPLLYFATSRVFKDPQTADEAVILLSILFCYTATFILFYTASQSLLLTLVFQLALLGAFVGGMAFKYRQEFFEAGFVSLVMFLAYRKKVLWWAIYIITILGSLNRETFIFALIALTLCLFFRESNWRTFLRDYAKKLVPLFLIYVLIYVGTRYYYGPSPYHGDGFMLFFNLRTIPRLNASANIVYVGGGVLFLFILSLIEGNRAYLHFILGYVIPLLVVSLFISNWYEHRIFYGVYPLIFAHVLHSLSQVKAIAPPANVNS
jgi:hypothetical protein